MFAGYYFATFNISAHPSRKVRVFCKLLSPQLSIAFSPSCIQVGDYGSDSRLIFRVLSGIL